MSSSGRLRLILASASPRRLALLEQVGIVPDQVVSARLDETPTTLETPAKLVARLAQAKARCIAEQFPGSLVLAADTVVACGRRVLAKAADEAEARRYLDLISGRRHRVYSGLCVIGEDGRAHTREVVTVVSVKRLGRDEIDHYIASGEWRDKAGAYAIQGLFSAYVRRINGSYSNVVGLPLCETVGLLKGLGYLPAGTDIQ